MIKYTGGRIMTPLKGLGQLIEYFHCAYEYDFDLEAIKDSVTPAMYSKIQERIESGGRWGSHVDHVGDGIADLLAIGIEGLLALDLKHDVFPDDEDGDNDDQDDD